MALWPYGTVIGPDQKPPASGAPADDEQNSWPKSGYTLRAAGLGLTGLHPWHWWTRNGVNDPRPGPGPCLVVYYYGAEAFPKTKAAG